MIDQLFIGDKPEKEKMREIVNREAFIKPNGGLWTSSFNYKYGSDWLRWCHDNNWYDDDVKGWILVPETDSNLFIVDSYEDLEILSEKYSEPFPQLKSVRNYLFDRMKDDFDGVHLTERGYSETHMSFPLSLYGWDCESTIWFRWKFKEVKEINFKRGEDDYIAEFETI